MATKTKTNSVTFEAKTKVNRKGVHAKSKTSSLKSSKNYSKSYNSQGRN